jgi:hypothetical protein
MIGNVQDEKRWDAFVLSGGPVLTALRSIQPILDSEDVEIAEIPSDQGSARHPSATLSGYD